MIVFGNLDCIPSNTKGNFVIYNLLSIDSRAGVYQPIDILPSATQFNYTYDKDFDLRYLEFIFSDDYYFYEFFSKIIYNVYLGYNVYIIIERNDIFDNMVESIIKIIQQRYGYNSAIINDPEDIYYLNQDESFSLAGLPNLDMDKERYSMLYAAQNTYKANDGSIKIIGYEGSEYV